MISTHRISTRSLSDVIVRTVLERGHWEGETVFRHWRTGKALPVSHTHFMIREPDTGRIIGMGAVTRDISEIKRAREEIERSNRRLAEADELKTRFFANVSHELRTPLTLILGPVEKHLRAAADLSPELRRDLEVVERNARTVLRHVNDLLDVARINAGRLKPEYYEDDAAAIIHAVADHFSTLANENHLQFIVETPPALPVQTDVDKLHRIVLNLLSNAFKFTPGGGRVRLSLREDGPRFRVEVADSGPGIPVDKREAVFERFEQLEADPEAIPRGHRTRPVDRAGLRGAARGQRVDWRRARGRGAVPRRSAIRCADSNGRSTGQPRTDGRSRRQATGRRASQASSRARVTFDAGGASGAYSSSRTTRT